MTTYLAGLRRTIGKHHPRAYCDRCSWAVTQGRGLSVERTGELAREHARAKGHVTRLIVAHVTQYAPDGSEWAAGRERLDTATAERTGKAAP